MTDSRSDSDSTPSKPRGLWSLMGASPGIPVQQSETGSVPAEQTQSPGAKDPPSETAPSKQRGLWGVMRQSPIDAPPVDTAHSISESEPEVPLAEATARREKDQSESPIPRSLFSLMKRANEGPTETDAGDLDAASSAKVESQSCDEDQTIVTIRRSAVLESTDNVEDDDVILEEVTDDAPSVPESGVSSLMAVIDPDDLEPSRFRLAATQARKQIWIGFGCGVAAIVASALSLLPNFLASVPATCLGFVAIIGGYLALTGASRRELNHAMRRLSLFGMLLGTVGIFLGPLVLSGLGKTLRESTGQQVTVRHLHQVGEGLDRHYAQHEAYPIGGTFARNEAGVIRGQHGWMTFLLPFVGEAELFRAIDQSKSFEDPANRNAMGRNISVYFAAGGDRSRIGDGFAVSHFAGLGGEIDDAKGLSHVGIFERDVAVKREEVTDGLSGTLIVGELAGAYPPWGDPENWRKVGRGLNKNANGFGSYSGNGCTFLLADGSVKFFNNKTDIKLLEKMSTRDGAE